MMWREDRMPMIVAVTLGVVVGVVAALGDWSAAAFTGAVYGTIVVSVVLFALTNYRRDSS